MKTKNDFKPEEITLIEYMWAYDWWLALEENKTWKRYHRSWHLILKEEQGEAYWPVHFECEWWHKFINLKEIK
mgnify:CR=1 FL=1